ncbi:MAG: hypothetical protein M1824_002451 [Vezdaea acicularis]|nr:MAG: hypothetical protein M1824_002451 [Vezdaea acicularis]
MNKKKKKALQAVPDTVVVLSESEIRRCIYVKAMQSDRFTVLIGSAQMSFQVPQELLIQHSSVFKTMCHPPFKESIERTIKLPEEKPVTFANFFIWLHALEPCIPIFDIESVIDLAIFAEKYHICYLKNQTSDVLRTALSDNRWRVTPEIITAVYSSVPAGTTLRQMFSLGFAVNYGSSSLSWSRRNKPTEHWAEWEKVFYDFPDLGWDYFQHIQKGQADASSIKLGGACRFHDHSDTFGWIRGSGSSCSYPYGVPLTMQGYKKSFGNMLEEPTEEQTKEIDPVDKALAESAYELTEERGPVDEAPAESAYEPAEGIRTVDEALAEPAYELTEETETVDETPAEPAYEPAEGIRNVDAALAESAYELTEETETVDEAPAEPAYEPAKDIGTVDESSVALLVLCTRAN